MHLGKPREQRCGHYSLSFGPSLLFPAARFALRDFCETQMAQSLLFTTTVLPHHTWDFAVQRILLSLQRGLSENASRPCLLLYPFFKRTRGDAGRRARACYSHIYPFACRGRGPAFGSAKPDAKQNVALLIFPAGRPGRTLFSSCDGDFPVPGIALLGGGRAEQGYPSLPGTCQPTLPCSLLQQQTAAGPNVSPKPGRAVSGSPGPRGAGEKSGRGGAEPEPRRGEGQQR